MKSLITAAAGCVLAVMLAGCGDNEAGAVCGDLVCGSVETAESCATDCGCGNGIANPGEDCDVADFGTATCESVAQRGGTLGCNADCTFDLTACDEYVCGNGMVEPGEECDGGIGESTCASVGFSAGDLACTSSCRFDAAGCCNNFCDAANTSVCAGDTVESCVPQANGCLGLEITDCAANDDVCDDSSGTATCQCIDRCPSEGFGTCSGALAQTCTMQADGCLALVTNTDCAATSEACAVGPQGATCVPAASGEDCSDPYPLTAGQNVIAWNAMTADYLTTQPSCNTSTLTGPDLVLAFTATVDGIVTFAMSKPASARQVVAVSSATCGTPTTSEVACASDFTPTSIGDTFAVTQGTTYHFYVRDTTSGSAALPNPLILDLSEAACAGLANTASNLSPAPNAVLATTSPVLSFDLQHPVNPSAGVITLTGDLGTSQSYDLATAPSQVTFSNNNRSVRIDPATAFLPGETITVSWSGLVDQFCGAAIPPPTWSFEILMPSCTPGTAGMVGTTMARRATGLGSFTEYFVTADANANGYVYLGGTSDLYRVPKGTGPTEDVELAAGLSFSQLGYAVAVVGSQIFSLDTTTSATAPFLWRLSTSGGVTWNPLGYGQYPQTAGDWGVAMFHDNGRLYIVTDEVSTGVPTEIWSVSTSAVSLPEAAVRDVMLPGEHRCSGIAGDAKYFYLACDTNDRIIRVDRTTFQTELITDAIPLNSTRNELHADDFDGNGLADALYVKTDDETVRYICAPAGAPPFWQDILVDFGGTSTTSNFGLGFDPAANVLWAYDDDTQELVSIQ